MTAKGSLKVTIANLNSIKSITIQHDNSGSYDFDPSIEIYKPTSGTLSLYDKEYPDFQLNNQSTAYLYNVNGISWSNRLAIPNGNLDGQERTNLSAWAMDGSGLKNNVNWVKLYLSVTDLEEGDRVRITYDDGNWNLGYNGIEFASNASALNSEAFNDINNNGELDEAMGEKMLQRGDRLDKQIFYTMTHDGHLDLCVYPQVRITKIEIYSDHRAQIECKDNGVVNGQYKGSTMYFNGTGQIKEKTYIMPGGLVVQFGNDNENEHALVTASIDGPASYINDYQGFKPARNSSNNVDNVPETGTFYRFTPEVSGIMHLKFKAYNVRYTPTNVYYNNAGLNLVDYEDPAPSGTQCPYYLKEANGSGGYSNTKWNSNGNQEATVNISNDIRVEAGKTYYLYGYWNGDFSQGAYCGVARLLEVTFIPDGYVQPLAKVIDNSSTSNDNLAFVSGYANPQVKKYLGNIVHAEPYIDGTTLKIKNIQYKDDADKAGVVLINFNGAEEPVYALTVAYDAGWNTNDYGISEGHTWDFSSKSLAIGRYADQNSTLYREANEAIPDWTFAYRVGGNKNWDPMYLNAYDMLGDNADMIEETEGLWFETGSNQSCLYNEFTGDNIHVSEGADPDRYVGILPGGKFTIPNLKQYDRVYIYMGSGTGSSTNGIFLNITNALDALGTPINSEYRVGGSLWNVRTESNGNHHNDPYYRGCYHFIAAADGDMTFDMVGGSMCKIYQITIHRGDHFDTTNMNRNNESGVGFFNEEGATTGAGGSYTIHYRGKGESIGAPEVVTWSGNLSEESFSSTYLTGDKNNVTFTSRVGDFGTFKLRIKDMDYTGQYVCDFCDRNFTVGYKEKVSYPCTWDFTDILTYSGNDIAAEAAIAETTNPVENKGWDLSLWDENGSMVVRSYDESIATTIDDTYTNAYEIFAHNKNGKGNQLYANGKIIPETKGLWFYFDNNDAAYNHCMKITADGLRLANESYENGTTCEPGESMRRGWWNYKMVIPNVDAGAAVYLRAARDESVKEGDISFRPWSPTNGAYVDVTETFFYKSYQFDGMQNKVVIGSDDNSKLYEANDGSGDYILAIYNSGSARDLTLTLNGWVLKKLSVSTDFKTLDDNGWASESRARVIDPELTSYLTGNDIETLFVTNVEYKKPSVGGTLTLANPTATQVLMANTDGQTGACLLHNTAGAPVSILNGGFHLFVPDMHDYTAGSKDNQKTLTTGASSWLKAQVKPGDVYATTDGGMTINYILSNKHYEEGKAITTNYDAFYRIRGDKVHSNGNQAYLPLRYADVMNTGTGNAIAFYFEGNQPTDGISEVSSDAATTTVNAYTIGGQKLQSLPTTSGLYIINGKKVVIK